MSNKFWILFSFVGPSRQTHCTSIAEVNLTLQAAQKVIIDDFGQLGAESTATEFLGVPQLGFQPQHLCIQWGMCITFFDCAARAL